MTFALRYLREHVNYILLQAVFVCVFVAAFMLYHLPLAAVLYPAGLCFLAGSLFAGISVYKTYRKHEKLVSMRELRGITMQDAFPENPGILEEDYRQLVLKLCGEMADVEGELTASAREMVDYFTVWVHQIKTPIASMRLNLAETDSGLAQRLKSDLLHIEQYVEMVLTYFKMGSESTDYVFREVSLDKVIRENIRRFRGDFILKRIRLEYIPVEETVVSDEKWLSFVIGQLLSNALKYTYEGSVTISLENGTSLCVRDTGIGIAPEDIPRIFEKGYTGGNGRRDKRASGLGLYLARQIAGRLGVGLSVKSEVEKGTTMAMDLSQILQEC